MKELKPYFKDKVICIAGAHSALGKSLAIELNKLKAIVVLLDYKKKPLKKIKKDFIREHVDSKVYATDYLDNKETKKIFKKIKQKFGKIDLLINLTNLSLSLEFIDELNWSNQLIYNIEDSINIIELLLPKRIRKDGGQVVNFVRLNDMLPVSSNVVDATSAFAIVGMTKALQENREMELRKVNLVCLGKANSLSTLNVLREENQLNIPQNVSYILKGICRNEPVIFEENWSRAKWMFDLAKPVINFRFLNKWKRKK